MKHPLVGIIMGSDSDLVVMKDAAEVLENFGESFGDFVLRTTDVSKDTFHFPVKNIEINFMGKEQTVTSGLVDELKFSSMCNGQEFIFYFEKKYGSDILVESEKIIYERN